VQANNTGGQGSRRAVAPSDDDDDDETLPSDYPSDHRLTNMYLSFNLPHGLSIRHAFKHGLGFIYVFI
jgi:hypothetical protein